MAKLLQLCLFVVFAAALTQSAPPKQAFNPEDILAIHNDLRNDLAKGAEKNQPGEKCLMKKLKWNNCIADNAKIIADQYIKGGKRNPKLNECGMKVQYNQKRHHFSKDKIRTPDLPGMIEIWWGQIRNESLAGALPHKLDQGVIGKYIKMAGANVEHVGCAQLSWVKDSWGFNAYVCGYGPNKPYFRYPIYINKDDCDCEEDECAEKDSKYSYLCTKMKGEEEEGEEDCDED